MGISDVDQPEGVFQGICGLLQSSARDATRQALDPALESPVRDQPIAGRPGPRGVDKSSEKAVRRCVVLGLLHVSADKNVTYDAAMTMATRMHDHQTEGTEEPKERL